MTPRELLASDDPADRRRGAALRKDRLRIGWTLDRALDTPIGPQGGKRERVSKENRTGEDSLETIAATLGLSRERVRQIENEALRKLRVALERDGLTADDVGAWLSRRSKGDEMPPDDRSHRLTARSIRYEPREVERNWEAEAEAMVRGIRETAAAHRMVERVVCGMEIAGGAW